ncbi:MAG: phosphate signaling complex protein PhoU [Kiritimatiellae bacterium]|nr:phosphate signaling complex protein PhoU [Kiritimatiellia bacterium]MCO5061698.1 phosphate signaling complex protein PhoU [Kiritimatiellia bacterium]MCO6401224.1 phosphate signaling complex protein PhoU [Verrucomicrobiota bacterium]
MPVHLVREIDKLKQMMLSLAAMVEDNMRFAVKAVAERDPNLAQKVIARDHEIDRVEVEVEEECLKIFALHQPVANDLRFIVAILKINHDLERIGDLAVNIAERAEEMSRFRQPAMRTDLLIMADVVQNMVSESIDAMINRDLKQARDIWLADDEIDARNRAIHQDVGREIGEHPEHYETLLCLLSVSRNLERIADHATSIAKDVIYMIEGEIVRHRSREFRAINSPQSHTPRP